MPKGIPKSRTISICHPDVSHKGKGLCERCYDIQWRRKVRNDPKRRIQMQAWDLKKHYGITPNDYQEMLSRQGGVCALCKKLPTGRFRLAVDHDHTTGRIRGLLCAKCNISIIGLEDKDFVTKAMDYIHCE